MYFKKYQDLISYKMKYANKESFWKIWAITIPNQ